MNLRIVIPSARASNLIPCVQTLLARDPSVSPSAVIVVDDGARAESETALRNVTWVDGVKPFVFARNVNLGIVAAGSSDVIVLNDDARLMTPNGFTQWAAFVSQHGPMVYSAGIIGTVCNPRQVAQPPTGTARPEAGPLAFVCVYLPRVVINRVGLLDERFVGYGYDDFDYCRRAAACGVPLAVWDDCVVDHARDVVSTYRTRADLPSKAAENGRLFADKWDAVV